MSCKNSSLANATLNFMYRWIVCLFLRKIDIHYNNIHQFISVWDYRPDIQIYKQRSPYGTKRYLIISASNGILNYFYKFLCERPFQIIIDPFYLNAIVFLRVNSPLTCAIFEDHVIFGINDVRIR